MKMKPGSREKISNWSDKCTRIDQSEGESDVTFVFVIILYSARPVGIMPCLARQFRKMVVRSNKAVLVSYFEPQQVVFSESGAAKLVHSMRMLVITNPTFVLVKCEDSPSTGGRGKPQTSDLACITVTGTGRSFGEWWESLGESS